MGENVVDALVVLLLFVFVFRCPWYEPIKTATIPRQRYNMCVPERSTYGVHYKSSLQDHASDWRERRIVGVFPAFLPLHVLIIDEMTAYPRILGRPMTYY